MRSILHLDLDAFYASVEQRDHPELRGRPVVVGGSARRGVVCAASYEARPFGVRSAMPMVQAMRLCPQAVVVPPRFSAYVAASEAVFGILERFTPLIEPLSLDEAFLDVTASVGIRGDAATQARAMRAAIRKELELPASAGIAPVKFAAKLLSDEAKPDGQREIRQEGLVEWLSKLPVKRMWGVGPKAEARLHTLGIRTLGGLAAFDEGLLRSELGDGALQLQALARGIDPREVVPDREAKSIGAEETFDEDLLGARALSPRLLEQAVRVARRMRKAGKQAAGISVKVKFHDFRVVTRAVTLPAPSADEGQLHRVAVEALERVDLSVPVRLTGISAHGLSAAGAGQLGLFTRPDARTEALHRSVDALTARFGPRAVLPATLLEQRGERVAGPVPERAESRGAEPKELTIERDPEPPDFE